MYKKSTPLYIAILGVLFFCQGCASNPRVTEAIIVPTQTELPPLATNTLILPTLTLIPPSSTPTREIIGDGNVQGLISAWDYTIQDDGFRTIALSPDGQILAAGTGQNLESPDQKIRLWDVSTGQLLEESEKVDTIIWDLIFSPTGSFLAVALDSGIVQLRDPQDLRQIQQLYFPVQ